MAILFGLAIFGFIIGSLGMAIPFLVIFIVYALVLMCLRKKIDMGIILIKVASQFLSEKWGVFVSPLIKVVVNILFSFFWIYSLNCIFAVSDDKTKNGQDNTTESIVTVLWFFIWLFFSFLFYYVMVFTVAVSCAFWYYRVEGRHYLTTAYKWLFTSAFGSIVFGAALVAVITLARLLVDSKRRETKNIAVAVCLCIMSMCLRNLENLFKILNHNSVIVMSVTGENYINSAKSTIGILSRFLGLMSVSDIITGLLVFWGIVLITGVTSVISYFWLDGKGLSTEFPYLFSLGRSCKLVFIFYCFDIRFKELGYSSNNMPAEINEALGNSNYEEKQ
ncbi:uncharacterized protein LOC116244943 [Nymphaea colorata]|uniref:uncharacterized protein LOC116244943 n=1 Tax=Nymphaea colorata TaxID=210225 RepID=UPI00129D3131|nr:uncharacterized protein LOC116244943 [Nymphaea colorata]